MADLAFRFDDITEQHYAFYLDKLRKLAATTPLPPRVSIEIGSNRGKFITELAARHPERFYVGIEYRLKYAEFARETQAAAGIENVLMLQADANLALPILFDDGQIEELFLLCPDPWWKQRHRKRRIIQPEFLDLMARKMPSGGMLWVRTDVGTLADDMREVLDAHEAFELLPFDEHPVEPFPRTTREVKIMRAQIPMNLLYYRRR